MKFGGLSESEVAKISDILNREGIPFTVAKDEDLEEFNSASMKNNLRHFTPPNISTHVLSIDIQDEDFLKVSDTGKSQLLDFGITTEIPSVEDFKPYSGHSIHRELVDGPKRLVVFNFKHQLILGSIFIIIFFIVKYL